MKLNLARLRYIFPRWPSELDVAKCATNWASMAQDFFSAGHVLFEEREEIRALMHSAKNLEMTERILRRMDNDRPAMFCVAFSLELAAKAAKVRGAHPDEFSHATELPFAKHDVVTICKEIPGFDLSASECKLLVVASKVVMDGKYPTGKRPRDDETAFSLPNVDNFLAEADPLYEKLMAHACDAQPCAPEGRFADKPASRP